MVAGAEGRRRLNPSMLSATQVRARITDAASHDQWFTELVTPQAASLILGIPADYLPGLSIVISGANEFVRISAGTSRFAAQQAFVDWATNPDDRTKGTFARDAYLVLYGLFQAARHGQGTVAFHEISRMFTETLYALDESWKPLVDFARGGGDIAGEADFENVGEKMNDLWSIIPPGMQKENNRYNPTLLFQ